MLLNRSPLSTGASTGFTFDLHVLGTPPAFVLSQDQTLRQDRARPPRDWLGRRSIPRADGPGPEGPIGRLALLGVALSAEANGTTVVLGAVSPVVTGGTTELLW